MSDVLNVLLQVLHKVMLVTQITSESFCPEPVKNGISYSGAILHFEIRDII